MNRIFQSAIITSVTHPYTILFCIKHLSCFPYARHKQWHSENPRNHIKFGDIVIVSSPVLNAQHCSKEEGTDLEVKKAVTIPILAVWLSFRQLWDWSPPSNDHASLQTYRGDYTTSENFKNQCSAETRDTEMLLCSQVIDLKINVKFKPKSY